MVRIKTTSAYLYAFLGMLVGFGILWFNGWKTATTSCYPDCPGLDRMRSILIPLGDIIFFLGLTALIGAIILSTIRLIRRIKK